MSERYFGKVVSALDKFTVVINKGAEQGVKTGDKFLVVGLGSEIIDPDTGEDLGKLEIVRGKVSVTHIQEKMSTARSCEFEKSSDVKEITKVSARGGSAIASILGSQDTVTESITPGHESLKELKDTHIGDLLLKP